jgi:uncharacterized phiE125 gp8 family phage protein
MLKKISDTGLEPITLAMLKKHCRIDNDFENDLLQTYLDVALEWVEQNARVQLGPATWQMQIDNFPTMDYFSNYPMMYPFPALVTAAKYGSLVAPWQTIHLLVYPVQSIDSITYLDTTGTLQTLDPSKYVFDQQGCRISVAANTFFPFTLAQINSVTINFTAGFGTADQTQAQQIAAIPKKILLAVLNYTLAVYENRDGVPEKAMQTLERICNGERQVVLQ